MYCSTDEVWSTAQQPPQYLSLGQINFLVIKALYWIEVLSNEYWNLFMYTVRLRAYVHIQLVSVMHGPSILVVPLDLSFIRLYVFCLNQLIKGN